MIPRPAQYILRFDDLCPTAELPRWQRFLPLIEEFGIRPILAIIPDNQDKALSLSPPDPKFWERMRAMEAAGATIAMHGYRHLCTNHGEALLRLHTKAEFVGVPEETQRHWIREGLGILRGQGLNPTVWVAPRHGFDHNTLRALHKEGIRMLSDGFARVPFTRDGVIWIPQQLWGPVEKSKGLWTICVHSNFTHREEVDRLHEFVRLHTAQFTSVGRVLKEFSPVALSLTERMYEVWAQWRVRVSRARSRRRHHTRN